MSDYTITASPETLLRQASMTAHDYFVAAIKTIDDQLGSGYAKEHPELIAAFMRTASSDFSTSIILAQMQDFVSSICSAISQAGTNA
jgi:hypothetical protein